MALVHRLTDIKSTTGLDEDGKEYLVVIEVREHDTFDGVGYKTRVTANGKVCRLRKKDGEELLLFCEALGKTITCRL